jgi:hypothetical protein
MTANILIFACNLIRELKRKVGVELTIRVLLIRELKRKVGVELTIRVLLICKNLTEDWSGTLLRFDLLLLP